ncbi:MAG TPA: class I SAM-dependent methyltransferase [Gammaproteobacteria bacterium]|nr:class I SAM-dependent methyltransferase [Gammaproteobacteria bacterium]
MPHPDWNESYATDEPPPWDTGEPNEYLVEFIRSRAIKPGRALDVGCGTGTQSIWLAGQGFSVLGVDVAPLAIEKARAKAADAGEDCRFEVRDFLNDRIAGGPFDFVFDLGCFHIFDAPADRARFAAQVAALLAPGGRWLSLIGSTEGPAREFGPPRRSARDVMDAIEPTLAILEFHSIEFHVNLPEPPAAWFCLSRPRQFSAQPSTVYRG